MRSKKFMFSSTDGVKLSAQIDLLEIADKCPVHKTLHSETKVDTILKESLIHIVKC